MYKTIFRVLFCILLGGGWGAAPLPARADNTAVLELLEILRARGGITEKEYEALKKTAEADTKTAAEQDSPGINTRGKLEFSSAAHKFRIGGRLMHDATLVGNDGVGNVGGSEQQFRRARIYLSGLAWRHWDWKIQFDLEDADDSGMSIEDAYIRYKAWKPASVTVGQRKAPFSLSELTSSKYITFIERPAPTALFTSESIGIGGRAPGLTLANAGGNHTLTGGFYLMRQRAGATDSISERKIDDGWGVTGRATWLPVNQAKNRLFHLGAAFGYKHYANGTVNRFRVRPGVSEGDRIVDSDGAIAADNFWAAGLEAAGIWGPFSASAEYYYGDFDAPGMAGDTDMEGFYIQGGYFLTGESRGYKRGAFSGVKVRNPVGDGGWGGWEVGLRYSIADLGDGIGGDAGEVLAAALNWYVNNNMMFKLNYIKTFCDSGGADTCDWGAGDGDPEYLSFRTQVFF